QDVVEIGLKRELDVSQRRIQAAIIDDLIQVKEPGPCVELGGIRAVSALALLEAVDKALQTDAPWIGLVGSGPLENNEVNRSSDQLAAEVAVPRQRPDVALLAQRVGR